MAALVLCWRLVDSEVTVMPSVMCVDWLHWWYRYAADVVPFSTASAFVTKMRNIHLHHLLKSKLKISERQSGWEIRCNNATWKSEQIADIRCNVRFVHSSVHTIHDNADRITESAKSGTGVFVYQDYNSPIRTKCMDALTLLLLWKYISKYTVWSISFRNYFFK